MTEQWKPIGDKWPQPAMVMIYSPEERNNVIKSRDGMRNYCLPSVYLHPMPAAITPEQQAVLDAAVEQNTAAHSALHSHDEYLRSCYRSDRTVDAMLAAQQPPDPVEELRAAANDVLDGEYTTAKGLRLRAAIAALEKKT